MLGYLNQPALSEELLDKDGFFATGDLVSMRDGILTVYGRMCDQIKCNGETYMTADLEKVLKEHGKVADCSVIAVPGKDGPVPWAFAVINSLGSSCPTLLPRELINFIEHQVGLLQDPFSHDEMLNNFLFSLEYRRHVSKRRVEDYTYYSAHSIVGSSIKC